MDEQSLIAARLAAANAMENPLSGLESLLSVKVDDSFLTIQFHSSPLPEKLQTKCLDLFHRNMGDMYQASDWGFDMRKKREELSHENARFLTCSHGDNSNNNKEDDLVAFAHFRFDVNDDDDPTEEVLYVYELQVDASKRRAGLGRRFMTILELVARRAQMKKCMLTVFKSNSTAIQFYTRMKYKVDEISPSAWGLDADYEILSKRVN